MNAIEAALKELRDRKAQLAEGLANSAARNFEEYKFICGEIRGLTAVEMYLLDLAKSMEQFDD